MTNTVTAYGIEAGVPRPYATWHVSTDSKAEANRFADALGRQPVKTDRGFHINTGKRKLDVIIDGLGGHIIEHAKHQRAFPELQPVVEARMNVPLIDHETPFHYRSGSWRTAAETPATQDHLIECGELAYGQLVLVTITETGIGGVRKRRQRAALNIHGSADYDDGTELETIIIQKGQNQ